VVGQPNLEQERQQVRHALVIDDPSGKRVVALDAATYSLGRDPTSAIRLYSDAVSRQHALLLRVPSPSGYLYKLIDGNSEGKRSANGVAVNGQRCFEHNLQNGDVIELSSNVHLTYQLFSNMSDAEFAEHIQSIDFVSIKSAAISGTGTLLMDDEVGQHIRAYQQEQSNLAGSEHPHMASALQREIIQPDADTLLPQPMSKKSGNTLLFVGIGAAVLIGLAVIVLFVLL
jgi:pSer/pThr/pTyr-binding forkhead associated (FHA) protein